MAGRLLHVLLCSSSLPPPLFVVFEALKDVVVFVVIVIVDGSHRTVRIYTERSRDRVENSTKGGLVAIAQINCWLSRLATDRSACACMCLCVLMTLHAVATLTLPTKRIISQTTQGHYLPIPLLLKFSVFVHHEYISSPVCEKTLFLFFFFTILSFGHF